MTESTPSSGPNSAPIRGPSVLAILVVPSAEPALRACLSALASQTYAALGVLAIDDGSSDDARELLVRALGEERVIRHDAPQGYARSFDAALALPVAAAADHVLLLHGDAVLDPDAVASLVEATTLAGVERAGIVGAKVVDLNHPRRLRDVGRSIDRFGHAMSPLQSDEIDQGQFDRVLEVLAVDGCAMLIARDVWQAIGSYDERLGADDVDLCWRAQLAGWRVLMTPRARVQHGAQHPDTQQDEPRSDRYEQDRIALASVLKNYGGVTLSWVVPLGVALTLVRLLFLSLGRHFEEAYELLAALGWNIAHLPSTLRRRRAVQRVRAVRDHALHHFTASAGLHIPRWFQTAERILEEQRELDEQDPGASVRGLRRRTASFVSVHPVLVGSFFGIIVGAFAVRALLSPAVLTGGAIPAFPSSPNGFFQELVSGFRGTGLGGSLAASPALAALGGISYATIASTAWAQKAIVIAGPAIATVLCYRAVVRRTGRPGPSVVAAAAYGLSALMLWAVSEGRIAQLFLMTVMPPLVERVDLAFARDEPSDGRWRFTVGLAVTIAVGVASVPGALLAIGLVALFGLLFGTARGRGLVLVAGAVMGAAILVFPFVPTIAGAGGHGLWSGIGQLDPWKVLRLSLGGAPGDWAPALFLPVAALFGLALAGGSRRGQAARAALTGSSALGLAWLSVAGYLPQWATNAPAYAALACVCAVFMIGDGLSSAIGGMERSSFGFRQIGGVLLAIVLGLGLSLQALAAMVGSWAIGDDRVPAAWTVVESAAQGSYNVVWLSGTDGLPFPSPGGDPTGIVSAGGSSVTYGLTDRSGALAIDTGRPLTGSGDPAVRQALADVLSGATVHGGSLLAPFGVHFVVMQEGVVPQSAIDAFGSQVDLELVPSAGLIILRNVVDVPPAGVLHADKATGAIVASSDPDVIQRFEAVPTTPLASNDAGWTGGAEGGNLAVVATEFDGAWQLSGSTAQPQRSFGWGTAFTDVPADVTIRYGDQLPRTITMWLLAIVWGAALWITRKPVRR